MFHLRLPRASRAYCRLVLTAALIIGVAGLASTGCSSDDVKNGWLLDTGVSNPDADAGPTDADVPDVSDTPSTSDTAPDDGAVVDVDASDTVGAEQDEPCERTSDCRGELRCVDGAEEGDQRQCAAPDGGCECDDDQWCTAGGECVGGDYCDSSEECHAGSCRTGHHCGDPQCSSGGECIGDEDCVRQPGTDHNLCELNACRCKNPEDICSGDRMCLRIEDCALSGCAEGYTCTQYGCVCADGPQGCQVPCSDSDQCGEYGHFVCSQNNYCEVQLCRDDSDCSDGFSCGHRGATAQTYNSDSFCVRSGLKPVGESCSTSSDCSTGYCRENLCVQECKQNSQCSGDAECVVALSQYGTHRPAYCRAAVCGDCASDERCNPQSRTCQKFCLSTAECDEGETCHAGHFYPICKSNNECERATESGTVVETCGPTEICANVYENLGCVEPCFSDSDCTARADCDATCPPSEWQESCRDFYCRPLDGYSN